MSARWGLLGVLGILIVNASAFAQEVIERQVKAQSGRRGRIYDAVLCQQGLNRGRRASGRSKS